MIRSSYWNKSQSLAVGSLLTALSYLTLLSASAVQGYAQCGSLSGPSTSWVTPGTDSWTTAGNWDGGVPTSSTNACIINGTAGTPTVVNYGPGTIGGGVGSLQLGANNTLSINDNSTLNVSGTQIINGGAIALNGNGNADYLIVNNSAIALSGGGTLTLANTLHNNNTLIYGDGGAVLDNVDNKISGEGQIGAGHALALTNETGGIVNANVGGEILNLNGTGGITNAGLLEATGNGILWINQTVNNAGGTLSTDGASGSVVQLLNGSSIQGGTLNGRIETLAGHFNPVIDGSSQGTLNNQGAFTVVDNSQAHVLGTINNTGAITLASAGNAAYLYLDASTTLTGGGTVTLSNSLHNGAAVIYGDNGVLLDNKANTIQGEGHIGDSRVMALLNESGQTINANVNGQILALDATAGITNAGTLEATLGGILQMNQTVNNLGGAITTDSGLGSVVRLQNGTVIQGGTLNGDIQTQAGHYVPTLDGSTQGTLNNAGTLTIVDNSGAHMIGTINNTGSILLNSNGNAAQLVLDGATTLTGGGTVTLSNTLHNNAASIYGDGGAVLDNVNNTIQGEGQLGLGHTMALVNEVSGIIDANVSGQTLYLNGAGGVTNNNILEATGGGILEIDNVVANSGGAITTDSGNGSYVRINNATAIQGGVLSGSIQTTAGNFASLLDGTAGPGTLTLAGTLTALDNSGVYVQGTINNTGAIALNSFGNATQIYLTQNTTLTGGGSITLSNTLHNSAARIYGDGVVLDNINNTISGEGVLGLGHVMGLTNEVAGVIDANVSGATLYLNGASGVTNHGLIEATLGGVLEIDNTIANTGATISTDTGNGSYVRVNNGTTIQGGTLNASVVTTAGNFSTLLDGTAGPGALTTAGTITVIDNSGFYSQGTLNNTGSILLNGFGNATQIYLQQDTKLTGSGTVTLSNTLHNNATRIYGDSVTLENAGNTIQGEGQIGIGHLFNIVNDAGGTFLANVTGQTLFLNGAGTLTNNGTLQANAGSLLHVAAPTTLTNFSGGVLSGGTYNVYGTATNAGAIQIESLGTGGGEITSNAATILLDGPNSNILDASSADALSRLSDNAGSFTIRNGRDFTSLSPFSNEGILTIGTGSTFVTGSGGGTYTQTAGTTTVDGTLDPWSIDINSGLLDGIGLLDGALTVDLLGTVTPGDAGSTGTLTDDGDFALNGTLDIGIGASGHDILDITGNATLGGTLDLVALDGFTLASGDTFVILEDGTRSGIFNSIDYSGLNLAAGLTGEVLYDQGAGGNEVELEINGVTSATPEPGTWFMLAVGLGALLVLRRKAARA